MTRMHPRASSHNEFQARDTTDSSDSRGPSPLNRVLAAGLFATMVVANQMRKLAPDRRRRRNRRFRSAQHRNRRGPRAAGNSPPAENRRITRGDRPMSAEEADSSDQRQSNSEMCPSEPSSFCSLPIIRQPGQPENSGREQMCTRGLTRETIVESRLNSEDNPFLVEVPEDRDPARLPSVTVQSRQPTPQRCIRSGLTRRTRANQRERTASNVYERDLGSESTFSTSSAVDSDGEDRSMGRNRVPAHRRGLASILKLRQD